MPSDACYSMPTAPKFGIEELINRGSEKDLEAVFSKIILDYLNGRIKFLNFRLGYKSHYN